MNVTIEDLSPELLVKIFSHYIESEGHVKFSSNVVPVCTTWWQLSTTPSLWKSIDEENWNYVLSVSNRGLLHHTESIRVPGDWRKTFLDPDRLSALLSNIRDLKSLEIRSYDIDVNTMTIVAEHCPNLERLHLVCVFLAESDPITHRELGPILTVCGPKLKQLHFTCDIADSERVVSEIAARCMSLEVLRWRIGPSNFPIYKIMRGCPQLRELELVYCKLVLTGGKEYCGFRNLTVFQTISCNFQGKDVYSLLMNSNNLEYLEVDWGVNFICGDVSKMSSNNIKFLKLRLFDVCMNLSALKQAVDKWKHSLLHLEIWGWLCGVTSVLKTYLDGNQCPKLKILKIGETTVDQSFVKTFIQKCQNLEEFHFRDKSYKNREMLMEFCNSL